MPLTTLSGSLSSTSSPDNVSGEFIEGEVEVQDQNNPIPPDIPKDAFTSHSTYNRMFDQKLSTAYARFIEGIPVNVVYYHLKTSTSRFITDDQGAPGTSVHYNYDRINGFEFKVDGSFSFSYDEEDVSSVVSGNGTCYPGFRPRVGDFFIYEVADNRYARFNVTSIERLTLHAASCFTIQFTMVEFVDNDKWTEYESKVSDVYYFMSEAYLGSQQVLLVSDEKALLDDVRKVQKKLKSYYLEKFFVNTFKSFCRTDGLYDPYVTAFMKQFFTVFDDGLYVAEALPIYNYKEHAYWTYLLNNDLAEEDDVWRWGWVDVYVPNPRHVRITGLIGHSWIELRNNSNSGICIEYPVFGFGDPNDWTESIDILAGTYLSTKKVDPILYLNYAQSFRNLDDTNAFYQLPVLLYLGRKLEESLIDGSYRAVLNPSLPEPSDELAFTADDLSDGWLVLPRTDPVLYLKDSSGSLHTFAEGEVNIDTAAHINVSALCDRLSLNLDQNWTVIFGRS